MQADIVILLRDVAYAMFKNGWQSSSLAAEAATTIERQRKQIESLRSERDAIRAETIEAAAIIADEYECSLMDYGGSVDAKHFYEGGVLDAGTGIAAAIRAMGNGEKP